LWRPPLADLPERIPAVSPAAEKPAENEENEAENQSENEAENQSENGLENRASPWFAIRPALALPPANSASIQPPDAEPEAEAPPVSRWFS
jgi:hypothetical protein